jgi:hypothetical protein
VIGLNEPETPLYPAAQTIAAPGQDRGLQAEKMEQAAVDVVYLSWELRDGVVESVLSKVIRAAMSTTESLGWPAANLLMDTGVEPGGARPAMPPTTRCPPMLLAVVLVLLMLALAGGRPEGTWAESGCPVTFCWPPRPTSRPS